MPEVTLSLPLALLLLVLFLAIGAVLVFLYLRQTAPAAEQPILPTATASSTATVTLTPTPLTPTPTDTPQPTPTPISYTVALGDTCSSIAVAFSVSIQSIVLLNNLPAACDTLSVGQVLLIPQPTPTPTPLPTATLSSNEATEMACEKATHVVQDTDTLSSIANSYNVPMAVIQEYNGLPSDIVYAGLELTIPLCEQFPTPGPTPTPTLPPPYSAPNLLLPNDGTRFVQPGESVTLQWASVGTLLESEAYQVTVIDFTDGDSRSLAEYVNDTKFIVPTSFRSNDATPHMYRWSVVVARQSGTDEDGNVVWELAGTPSDSRVFMWAGAAAIEVTPTP